MAMTIKEKHIAAIADHMQYIRLTMSDSNDRAAAQFLYNYLRGLGDEVVRRDLQEAVDRRQKLNGRTKADH